MDGRIVLFAANAHLINIFIDKHSRSSPPAINSEYNKIKRQINVRETKLKIFQIIILSLVSQQDERVFNASMEESWFTPIYVFPHSIDSTL